MKKQLLFLALVCVMSTKTLYGMSEIDDYEGEYEGEVEDPSTFSPKDKLFQGAINNDFNLVRDAYNQLVNLNVQDQDGNTALMLINPTKGDDIAEFLLDLGASPNIQNNVGYTALMYAVSWNKSKKRVQLLLNAKANPDIQNNKGDTALIIAAIHGDREIVQLLLNANADIEIKNKENETALYMAQKNNNNEVVQVLKDEQKKRREVAQKEASKHLPKVLTEIVSEYFVSCPKDSSNNKPEKLV